MLTPNDIREVRFTKAMGGYKTTEVDDFLDQCVETVEELLGQIESNKQKMQVLAESVMEYRQQEDTIRTALITAQKAADSIVEEAKQKAAAISDSADEEAELMREKALLDTEAEQKELQRVRQEVADFKSRLLAMYREHLTLIGVLEGKDKTETVAASKETVPEAKEAEAKPEEPPFVFEDISSDRPFDEELPDFSALKLPEEEE